MSELLRGAVNIGKLAHEWNSKVVHTYDDLMFYPATLE